MARLFDDASTQYGSVSQSLSLPITMACWFYCDDASNVGTLMQCSDGTDDARFNRIVVVGIVSPKQIRANSCNDATGATQGNSTTTAWAANTWHHAVAVFASATSRTIYLDGVAGTTDTTNLNPTMATTYIGLGNQVVTGKQLFSGRLADAAIWNVSLNANEAAALARGVPACEIRPESQVPYYPLYGLDSPEPDWHRIGGTRYALALTNTPTQANHAPVALGADWWGRQRIEPAATTGNRRRRVICGAA